MKKIFLTLAISASLLGSTTMYAATKTPNQAPTLIVKQAFTKEFAQIKDVEWTTISGESVFQATFSFNNESIKAFFTEEGEFLGTTRQIVKSQLPIGVLTEMDKQYANARVATIFEYSKKDGLAYYITLVTPKGALVIKASGSGDLSVYKRNVQ